jgi:hypothetical protein
MARNARVSATTRGLTDIVAERFEAGIRSGDQIART